MRFKHFFVALIALCASVNIALAETKTFVVTNTNADGEGSLAGVVEQINGLDETESAKISFDLPDKSVIAPAKALLINRYVEIDGGDLNITIQNTLVFYSGGDLANIFIDGKSTISNGFYLVKGNFSIKNCCFSNLNSCVIYCNSSASISKIEGCNMDDCYGPIIHNDSDEGLGEIQNCNIKNCKSPVIYNKTTINSIINVNCENVSYGIMGDDGSEIKVVKEFHSDSEKENHFYGELEELSSSSFGGKVTINSKVGILKNCIFDNSIEIHGNVPVIDTCIFNNTFQATSSVGVIKRCRFEGNVSLSGDINMSIDTIKNCIVHAQIEAHTTIANINRCDFVGGGYSNVNHITGVVKHCNFSDIEGPAFKSLTVQKIDSCNFENCIIGIYVSSLIDTISNVTIKKCGTALSESSAKYLYNCVITDNKSGVNLKNGATKFIKNCTILNNGSGLKLENNSCNLIRDCKIENNGIFGVWAGSAPIGDIKNCSIVNNKIGIDLEACKVSTIDSCDISNDSIGISNTSNCSVDKLSNVNIYDSEKYGILICGHNSYKMTNCVIGRETLNDGRKGNGVGIFFKGASLDSISIEKCIISGNLNEGISVDSGNQVALIVKDSYVGTNAINESLGNGKDGILFIQTNAYLTFINSTSSNNGENGLNIGGSSTFQISNSVFESNNKYGILDSTDDSGFGPYVDTCRFSSNQLGGISNYQVDRKFKLSKNLFLNTTKQNSSAKAIVNRAKKPKAPIVSTENVSEEAIKIYGTIDTAAIATIEIFSTDGDEQTAKKYLGSVQTNANGDFSFSTNTPQGLMQCYVATATIGNRTSELSDPSCWLNDDIHEYYVTTTGSGSGISWEDPMSPESFAEMAHIARSGATFHVGAGSYDLNKINNSSSVFNINSGITIRGGYPANPETGINDKSDPTVNTTLFHTNSMRFYYDYARFVIDSNNDDVVNFKSITFSKATIQNMSQKLAKLVVDSCTFYHALSDSCAAIYSKYGNNGTDSIIIKNTSFTGETSLGKNCVAKILSCGDFLMENCKISSYKSELPLLDIYQGNSIIKNNTIANNTVPCLSSYNKGFKLKYYYNTIVGNTFTDWVSGWGESTTGENFVEYYDNIIGGGDGISEFGDSEKEYTSNNVTDRATASTTALQVASFAGLLQGSVNTNGVFTPVLAKNGGFTDNVKLLVDTLSDGKTIRRDLDHTIVTDDQRGVVRLDMTCPGSYEAEKSIVRRALKDTICRTGIYTKHGFEIDTKDLKGGAYEYKDSIVGSVADTVYKLSLYVNPLRCGIDTSALAFYVKIEAEGKGDGSRWEDAMSAEDFVTVLPLAKQGATFYVAEGKYNLDDLIDEHQLIINNGVSIVGGFDKKAETGAISDPSQYKTDIASDDNYYGKEIYIVHEAKGNIEFHNLKFSNSYIHNYSANFSKLIVDSCEFSSEVSSPSYPSLIYNDNGNGAVEDSIIVRNSILKGGGNAAVTAIVTVYGDVVKVCNSTFSDFRRVDELSMFYLSFSKLIAENNTVVNNSLKGLVNASTKYDRIVKNNTIVANKFKEEGLNASTFLGNIYADNNLTLSGDFDKSNIFDDEVLSLLDGSFESGTFVPNLTTANGGYTPTVKVKSTNLNGASIRFNQTLTDLATDQRGVARFNMTCPGAYEADIDESELAGILDGIDKKLIVTNQKCSGGKDGQLDFAYSGNSLKGELVLVATDAAGESYMASSTEEKDTISIKNLASGVYKLSLKYTVRNTTVEAPLDDATILDIDDLKLDEASAVVARLSCASSNNGSILLPIQNWIDGDSVSVYSGSSVVWGTSKVSAYADVDTNETALYYKGEAVDWNGGKKADVAYLSVPNLGAGTYQVTVYDQCGHSYNYPSEDPVEFSTIVAPSIALVDSVTKLPCANEPIGMATFQVSGGDASTSAFYFKSQTGEVIVPEKDGKYIREKLAPGTYTATYKSKNEECADAASHTFKVKALDSLKIKDANGLAILCTGAKGQAEIVTSGGKSTYEYILSSSTSKIDTIAESDHITINNLTPNVIYTLTVKDGGGCSATYDGEVVSISDKVNNLSSITVDATAIGESCYNKKNGKVKFNYSGNKSNAKLVFTLKGVDEPIITSNASDELSFENLAPGSYALSVGFNEEGCDLSLTDKVVDDKLEVSAISGQFKIDSAYTVDNSKASTCYKMINGYIETRVKNFVNDVDTLLLYQNGGRYAKYTSLDKDETGDYSIFKSLVAIKGGIEMVVVKDGCGYRDSVKFPMAELTKPAITLVEMNDNLPCSYSKTASVKLQVSGGNYATSVFTADNGDLINLHADTTMTFDKLGAGTHTFRYKSTVSGCPDDSIYTVTFTAPDAMNLTFKQSNAICDEQGGKAVATVSGGTKPFVFTWKNEDEVVRTVEKEKSDTLASVPVGEYTLSVVDFNSCSVDPFEFSVVTAKHEGLDAISVTAKADKQHCYGVDNGSVNISYSNNSDLAPLKFSVKQLSSGDLKSVTVIGESNKCAIEALAPGKYVLYLDFDYEGCTSVSEAKAVDTLVVDTIKHQFEVDKEYLNIKDPTCSAEPNGFADVRVIHWDSDYTLHMYNSNSCYLSTNGLAPIKGDTGYAFMGSTLVGGTYKAVVENVCGYKDSVKFELKEFSKPTLSVDLVKGITTCNPVAYNYHPDGEANIFFNGGRGKEYGSLTLEFPEGVDAYGKSSDKEYYLSSKVKAGYSQLENLNMDPVSGTTYYLDSLPGGIYGAIYKSTIEGCSDYATAKVTINSPAAIRTKIASEPVTCKGTTTAEFSIVPNYAQNIQKYVYVDQAQNMAEEYLNGNLGDNFIGYKSLEIKMLNADGSLVLANDTLKKHMMNGDKLEEKSYPLEAFWQDMDDIKGNAMYGDSVYSKWIGFANLPANVYYVVTTDGNNCEYRDEIDLTKDPTHGTLKLTVESYPEQCAADKRRLHLKAQGGWENYAFSITDINEINNQKYTASDLENAENEDNNDYYGGAVSSQNYKAGDTLKIERTNGDYIGYYKSAILMPGTYRVSVMDDKGCIVTLDEDIVVKTNIEMSGKVALNKCDATSNEIDIVAKPSDNITYYAIRYENDSVGEKIPAKDLLAADNGGKRILGIPSGIIGIFAYDVESGCSGYDTFFVADKPNVLLHFLMLDSTKASCFGDADASISFNMSGGYWPFQKLTIKKDGSNDSPTVLFDSKTRRSGDLVWEKYVKSVTIEDDVEKLSFDYEAQPIFEVADKDTFETTDRFTYSKLSAGAYIIELTDKEGCTTTSKFGVGQPSQIQIVATASPICPNDSARIYPTLLRGGVGGYKYAAYSLDENPDVNGYTALDDDSYDIEDHIGVVTGNYLYVVKDTNNCVMASNKVTVGTDRAPEISQDYLVAKYHDIDDVLVIEDVSSPKDANVSVAYDSMKVVFNIEQPKNGKIVAQVMPKEYYTYGVKLGEKVKLWDDTEVEGPQWGVPSDIVAGVKSQSDYNIQKERLKKLHDSYTDKLIKIGDSIKLMNDREAVKSIDRRLNDTLPNLYKRETMFTDSLSSVKMQEHSNCTLQMIKDDFQILVEDGADKRMTFVKLISGTSLVDVKDVNFTIDVTSYFGGCSYHTLINNMHMLPQGGSDDKYGLKQVGGEIVELTPSPSLIEANQMVTLIVKLAQPQETIGLELSANNILGEVINAVFERVGERKKDSEGNDTADFVPVSKDDDGYYEYEYQVTGIESTAIIKAVTKHDSENTIVLVK